MAKFYYNQEQNSYAIATNFEYKETPKGFKEITEKKFNEDMKKIEEKASETPEGDK